MKFGNDTKLSGEVDSSERKVSLQEKLDRLEEQANENLMKFNKDKSCKDMSCTWENIHKECSTD